MNHNSLVKKTIEFNDNLKHDNVKHICFGVNCKFCRPLGVAITSIFENNRDLHLQLHIFTDYFENIDLNKFEKLSEKYKQSIKIYYLDSSFFEKFPPNSGVSESVYFRLCMIDELDVDRCLYLDADIICLNSLNEFYEINFTKEEFVAVVDDRHPSESKRRNKLYILKDGKYFNAGVMFIDVNTWKKENVKERCLKILIKDASYIDDWDQGILNIVLDGRTKYIKEKFNFWPKNILYTLRNVVIRHYIGKKKPWKLCKVASRDVWEKYSQNSLWADIPMEEPIAIPQNYRLIKEVSKYYFCKNNISSGMLCFLLSDKKRIIVFGSANIIALLIIAIQYIYASMINMGRVPGLIGGPNLVSVQILMLMPICLVARRYFTNFKYLSILNLGVFLLSGVALLMTESRGSWLGLGLALIIAFLVNGRPYLLTVKRYSIIIMCALIIIIGNSNYIISRINHTVNYTENYTVERIYIWQSSLNMFKDNVWSGIGIGGERFRELYDNQYMLSAAKEKHIPHPHNLLLFYLSETGILGFVGFFIFFMCPFLYFIKNMLGEEAFSVIAKYAFFFLLSFVISQMVDSAFAFTKILRIYLAVLVFFISAFALYKRDYVSVEADKNV